MLDLGKSHRIEVKHNGATVAIDPVEMLLQLQRVQSEHENDALAATQATRNLLADTIGVPAADVTLDQAIAFNDYVVEAAEILRDERKKKVGSIAFAQPCTGEPQPATQPTKTN